MTDYEGRELIILTSSEYPEWVSTGIDRVIYDIDSQLRLLENSADLCDYIVSIASGVLCGVVDNVMSAEIDLRRGRDLSDNIVESFVLSTARFFGFKGDSLSDAVRFLEEKFPIPSDGSSPDFGGGLSHHLRDFAHHPTMLGLCFSLLTQFTGKAYGTDVLGNFIAVDVPERSLAYIGGDAFEKLQNGIVTWFFHLVSDVAGSSGTAGLSGGTGIPGPILSLAKELSTLPFVREFRIDNKSTSQFISKLFNGTLFARRDESGKLIKDSIYKFDLRGELAVGLELGRQAIPVLLNECIVRTFYFIRRLAVEIKLRKVRTLEDFDRIKWNDVKPCGSSTLARMLTISTGVFITVDIASAAAQRKYWVAVNYVGVGRFALAIGQDVAWSLKGRDLKRLRRMYERIRTNTFTQSDNAIYRGMGNMYEDTGKFELDKDQTEILYNLELRKTLHDIEETKAIVDHDNIKRLKQEWSDEWKQVMEACYTGFTGDADAKLHWYSKKELVDRVEERNPEGVWFRLVLLEAMLFEPYYPMSAETDENGNKSASKKYSRLKFNRSEGDKFLDSFFAGDYYTEGYIKRLRDCYKKVRMELNEVFDSIVKSIAVMAAIAIPVIAAAGIYAPALAVGLVGSKFVGLSGAALTSACLAYLGGGAVAVGGAGMAGGMATIVGGAAILSFSVGSGAAGVAAAAMLRGKSSIIADSAKLMVALREIFLNDEHDIEYSVSVEEQYVNAIKELESLRFDLELQADTADKEREKELQKAIKQTQKTVGAMRAARKSMAQFTSSFETGLEQASDESEKND